MVRPDGPFRAFVLAAGLGTRLRPLTSSIPKPMLPVVGRPMLDHALALAGAHGIAPHEVIVNAHHHWRWVAAWAEQRGVGLQIELPDILGTGGGLRAARERLAERFVVLNGDILCDVDLTALLEAVPPGGAAMALREDARLGALAPVEADDLGVVRRMRDFAGAPGRGRPGTFFTGIHACTRELLAHAPDGFSCILRTAYRSVIDLGLIRSVSHAGVWLDVGAPAEYLDANLAVSSGAVVAPAGHGAGYVVVGDGVVVGPGARLDGQARRSVVGAGAVVPGEASLDDCVVWDGLVVPPGAHRRAVLWGEPGAVAQVLAVDALPPAQV